MSFHVNYNYCFSACKGHGAEPGFSKYMYSNSPNLNSFSDFISNSPLLKHLGEAGLLNDVSALLARARSRDESNLRRIQGQAKGKLYPLL